VKKKWIILVLLLASHSTLTQVISGIIRDSLTNNPLPLAHIVNVDLNLGTFSNEAGEFSIRYDQLPFKLVVSHVAYQTKRITIDQSQGNLEIHVSSGITQLDDVVITNVSLEAIIKEAWKRNKALRKQEYFGKAFYRQITTVDEKATEVQESFYEVLYNNQGFERWQMTNGRYALNKFLDKKKKEKTPNSGNFSALSKVMGIYYDKSMPMIFPVGPLYQAVYEYELEDYSILEGDTLLVINCIPKPKFKSKNVFGGLLTIRQHDYALLNFKGTMKSLLMKKSDKYFKYYDLDLKQYTVEIDFTVRDNLTSSQLNYILVSKEYNHKAKDKKDWRHVKIESKLYFYKHQSSEGIKITKKKKGYLMLDDRKLISELVYDPDFWRLNPIVKRTLLEEDVIAAFDNEEAFVGTMFRKDN